MPHERKKNLMVSKNARISGVLKLWKTCRWKVHCQTMQLSDTFRFSYQIISGLSTTTGPNQIWCPEAFVVGKKQ